MMCLCTPSKELLAVIEDVHNNMRGLPKWPAKMNENDRPKWQWVANRIDKYIPMLEQATEKEMGLTCANGLTNDECRAKSNRNKKEHQ